MGIYNNIMMHGQVAWRWFTHADGRRNIHLDPTQHGVVVVDAEHHEIHEGHMWHWSHYDLDFDNAEDFDLVITTPTPASYDSGGYGPYVHFAGQVVCSGACVVSFIEGIDTIVGGTAKTPMNRNRLTSNSASTVLTLDPTSYGTSSATTLETTVVGTTGNPAQRVGGDARTNIEWLLTGSTSYVLNIEPEADNLVLSVSIDFYEHYHKDNWNEELI